MAGAVGVRCDHDHTNQLYLLTFLLTLSALQVEAVTTVGAPDLGLPAKREKLQPVIDKTEVRQLEFKEKTISSMEECMIGIVYCTDQHK